MSKPKKVIRIVAVITLLAGIVVFLYPYITQWLYNKKAGDIMLRFDNATGQTDFDELYCKLQKENKKLFEEGQKELKDPFSYSQPGIDLKKYGLKENIIGYVDIPKMNIKLPIYLGASEYNMSQGAVHLTQTSYPIGGENTNSVIAAHRGYSQAYMFREIEKLQPGDKVYIKNFKEKLEYRVVNIKIIAPTEIEEILIEPGKDKITLMSCHPFMVNNQRYIVYCERVQANNTQ